MMEPATVTAVRPNFDAERVRKDFPILATRVHGKALAYLDNAATTQKPNRVIDAESEYYRTVNANVHRGVHTLSERATSAYEAARQSVRSWINADSEREVVFVRGTTEGINLVAATLGREKVAEGDEILVTGLEHHSNIVPWQMLCGEKRASLKVAGILDNGEVDLDEFKRSFTTKTRIVAIAHVSNALGTVNPVREMVRIAHARGVPVLIDGAQAMPHGPVDVKDLDCDFYVFSGHKMFGPTGVGVLYGKESLLSTMPPYQGGGDMIKSVSFAGTTFNDLPYKFEAGTPNIAGVVGLGAAVEYLRGIDWRSARTHEEGLVAYASTLLSGIPGVRLIGTAQKKAGVVSFVLDDVHPHDIGTILDREGIAVRTGHHCAQPVMERFGIPATARASFALYNTSAEVERLADAVGRVRSIMGF